MNSIKNILAFFFGFKGRTNRTYFALLLPVFIAIQVFMALYPVAFSQVIINLKRGMLKEAQLLELIPLVLIVVVYFWLKYAYLAKRAHDFNKAMTASKLVNVLFLIDLSLFTLVLMYQNFALALPNALIAVIVMIRLAFIKGTEGENSFGPEPIVFWKNLTNNKTI